MTREFSQRLNLRDGRVDMTHGSGGRAMAQLMIDKGINSPLASSAGRLFDAVVAALGICLESVSFEGQAAIQLEALVERHLGERWGVSSGAAGTNPGMEAHVGGIAGRS